MQRKGAYNADIADSPISTGENYTPKALSLRIDDLSLSDTAKETRIVAGLTISAERVAAFWGYVNKSAQCWQWTAGTTRDGYGQFYVGRIDGRQINDYAHRVSYQLTHGPIPDGLVVRHSCDNPRCTRPSHLLLGTQAENIGDAQRQGKYARPRRGKWTIPAEVRAAAIAATKRGELAAIAKQTGFSLVALSLIRKRARLREAA